MPTYRYYTTDLLTGAILADVELYGVFVSKYLSRAGTFNGTVKLTEDPVFNALTLEATEPGKTALYMMRDNALVWGGIIWSRTYSDVSRAVQLAGQTFESYFDHVVFENHFVQQKVNQELIFQNMVNQLQTDSVDLDFQMAALPTTNMPRTVLIPGYEYHYATDALTQLVGVDNGLEYTIDVTPGPQPDQPIKTIRLGYPQLGVADPSLAYDFPGSVVHYWMPENAANSGAKFAALGYGSGDKITRAVATDQNTLDAGYPAWWIVNQYSTIADLGIIQDKVAADAIRLKMPLRQPTFEIRPQFASDFNAWNDLGNSFFVHIEDVRYPYGEDITSRMIGWELQPASAEGQEMLKLVVEGADA